MLRIVTKRFPTQSRRESCEYVLSFKAEKNSSIISKKKLLKLNLHYLIKRTFFLRLIFYPK